MYIFCSFYVYFLISSFKAPLSSCHIAFLIQLYNSKLASVGTRRWHKINAAETAKMRRNHHSAMAASKTSRTVIYST